MMKKLSFLAMMVALGSGMAVAGSLSIPWFVDNAPVGNGVPGKANGVTGLITLKSTINETIECWIDYYDASGSLIPRAASDGLSNTFTVAPLSALAFRPCFTDPDKETMEALGLANPVDGGQEGLQGYRVPNRPVTNKKTGAAVISWVGYPATALQGNYSEFRTIHSGTAASGQTQLSDKAVKTVTLSYGHLLPPGVGAE